MAEREAQQPAKDLDAVRAADPAPATVPVKPEPGAAAAEAFADVPIEIRADETRFEGGIAIARGNATLKRKDLLIQGDEIRYDPNTKEVHAIGGVVLSSEPHVIETEDLKFDLQSGQVKAAGKTKTADQ